MNPEPIQQTLIEFYVISRDAFGKYPYQWVGCSENGRCEIRSLTMYKTKRGAKQAVRNFCRLNGIREWSID